MQSYGSFVERMIEVLRRSPVLHVGGGKTVQLVNIRPPARSLSLSAEGLTLNALGGDGSTSADEPAAVAFVFGPENGAISEKLVHSALQEAQLKSYTHLYVIGFAIQPHARQLIDNASVMGLAPATYVQATPDLMMGDLLKNMRSSQIFSVCGLPEVALHPAEPATPDGRPRYEWNWSASTHSTRRRWTQTIEAAPTCPAGCSTRTTTTSASAPRRCSFLGRLPGTHSGRRSRPTTTKRSGSTSRHSQGRSRLARRRQIAVKAIDDRGNELLVVKALG